MSALPAASGVAIHAHSDERRQQRLLAARGRRAGLVLVDLQNDYCHPDGVFARAGFVVPDPTALVAAVNALIAAARASDAPVVWTATVWRDRDDLGRLAERSPFLAEDGLRRNSWGAQLLDGLDVDREADLVVEKRRFSAFHETALADELAARRLETLVVGGVRTDFCVESTVRDAFFRDYDVFVVEPATAGYVPALHEHSLQLMNTVFAQVVDLRDAQRLLAASGEQPGEG
jgi:ureidoacrylate peracid hydrolase